MQDHRKYWEGRGIKHKNNQDPLESICCSGRSILFNNFCDHIQKKAYKGCYKVRNYTEKKFLKLDVESEDGLCISGTSLSTMV